MLLRDQGDAFGASEHLTRAQALFESVGQEADAEDARRALAGLV